MKQYYAIKNKDANLYWEMMSSDFYSFSPDCLSDDYIWAVKMLKKLKPYYPNIEIEVFIIVSQGSIE